MCIFEAFGRDDESLRCRVAGGHESVTEEERGRE